MRIELNVEFQNTNADGNNTDYDADDEGTGIKSDEQLMPPPPAPSDMEVAQDKKDEAEANKRRLETPLAAMLPSKYANIEVTDLFPDFRPDKVNFLISVIDSKIS